MSVFSIEVFLALLGLGILIVAAFLPKVSDRKLAWTGIGGCVVALLLMDGAWVAVRMFGTDNPAKLAAQAAEALIEAHS